MKYGPTKSELRFRIGFSLIGLAMVVFALWWRGLPTAPAGFEAIIMATVFFIGTLGWSLYRYSDADD